jgi:endosialidase-like protein
VSNEDGNSADKVRRNLLKTGLGGGAIATSGTWVKPVLRTVIVPAHAATSPATTTTTSGPTTTAAPTTATSSPTTVTASPTTVTASPTTVTASPTTVTAFPTTVTAFPTTVTFTAFPTTVTFTAFPTTVTFTAFPTTVTLAPSDRRLKKNIAELGEIQAGLPYYKFEYIWGEEAYVGVMAQDVSKIAPHAVVEGADGYLRVDYEALGLRMATYREWLADPKAIRARLR